MQVIKDKEIKLIDWEFYVEGDEITDTGNIIFTYPVFEENREIVFSRTGLNGVSLTGATPVDAILSDLSSLPLIALAFPNFADGRCFSHARLLRVNHNYQGDLLAFGDILRDQLAHMLRCGINMMQFSEERNIKDALHAFDEFTTPYQTAVDDQKIIDDLR